MFTNIPLLALGDHQLSKSCEGEISNISSKAKEHGNVSSAPGVGVSRCVTRKQSMVIINMSFFSLIRVEIVCCDSGSSTIDNSGRNV